MKFSILILLILFNYANTSPDGAPAGACSSMTPGHINVFSQACSSNYIIQADKTEYYSNDTVRSKYIDRKRNNKHIISTFQLLSVVRQVAIHFEVFY